MAVETVNSIADLDPANPTGADKKSDGDNHLRNIKKALKADFPNITGPMTLTQATLNGLPAEVAAKGAITGQTWTGTHTFPATTYGVTAPPGSSGLKYATLDYVNNVALGVSLPAQTGNAGKVVATDGTTAGWYSTIPTIHVYETSTTWVADVPRIRLTVTGGGGSNGTQTGNNASGGAGGGTAIKTLDVTVGATYTIVIGAGGAAVTGTDLQGQAGGTSSFSGPGIATVSATGGGGGRPLNDSADGGIGVGGDINFRGGMSSPTVLNQSSSYAQGGSSYFGPGGKPRGPGTAYGEGAGGSGYTTVGHAGAPGVVVIEKLVIGA